MMIKPPLPLKGIEIEVMVQVEGMIKQLDYSFPWDPFGTVYLSSMLFDDKTFNCSTVSFLSFIYLFLPFLLVLLFFLHFIITL